jgi:DNA-binding winged helix-turn-helix (wHTH) protein
MSTGLLRRRGLRIKLQPMSKRVLLSLAAAPGEIVRREVLYQQIWPNPVIADVEHGLNTAVKKLRAALNDNAEQPRYIETVPRVGYRFIAPLSNGAATEERSVNQPQAAAATASD